ncbi:ATP synthase protein I [Mesobacillus persicus]|uniref:ATP synthase protein I n=1 Tax=Mesobacillus persicus TaxID=930146 RepID=A0A1H8H6R4_9BACI|nr:ATP synthase subunit I [Mesobacillus persicus]SEN51679.1 ATP synthase protein I [Mesobacillus persicus]
MQEWQQMTIRYRKYMFYLLALYVLGWGFTSYQSVFAGLILGTSLGFFNMWLLAKKTDTLGKAVTTGTTVRTLGTLSRMATAVLAVIVALRYPDIFHFISVIIGLMTYIFVIMIDYFLHSILIRK